MAVRTSITTRTPMQAAATDTPTDCTPFEQTVIDFKKTGLFSPLFLDYMGGEEKVEPFYHRPPTLEAFQDQIKEKGAQFPKEQRLLLAERLLDQYQGVSQPPTAQIEKLKEANTFTVTTGHQLNIFSGPLYFIYKIVSTINLADKLNATYPDSHFVPVYWMATEDHDFEEISHFRLFGKKYQWEKDARGAVGHLSTDGLEELIGEVGEVPDFFRKAYRSGKNLAQATREYVHHLFGEKGLIVVDADDASLKKALQPAMKADIFDQAHKLEVEKADKQLESLGYKTQVFARYINFFYLDQGVRERIEWGGEKYEVLNTDITFSKEEMEELIKEHPERLSPNVVLRPLYQELILPNLAYLGGPAEVVYWLQLKGVFDLHKTAFPLVMPRNFALVVHGGNAKKYEKVGLMPEELFLEEHELRKRFVENATDGEIDLKEEAQALAEVFDRIIEKAAEVDPSLKGFVGKEQSKAEKSLGNIEKRLQKAEEKRQEIRINQMQKLKESLFPNGAPQERADNFLNLYLNDPQFIDRLYLAFNPLHWGVNVLVG